ncbi:HAD family phosphatase [bacterium]|nr:HAD family phosphatase [candidate division CSSED10-310 bacterium]
MTSSGKWLLISDVDGTLTTETSIWETFHKKLGKWESEGLPNLRAFESGVIDYEHFAALDAKAYAGISRETMAGMALSIPRRQGMEAMLRTLSRRGFIIALVSTGLDILLDQIPHAHVRIANRLKFENGFCTGEAEVVIPIGGKASVVDSLLARFDGTPERTVVLGDSPGDIPMMHKAGYSIAIAADPGVQQIACASVDGSDLMRLPALIMDYRDKVELAK